MPIYRKEAAPQWRREADIGSRAWVSRPIDATCPRLRLGGGQDDERLSRRMTGTKRYFTVRSFISNSAFDVSISGVAAGRVQR